MPLSFTTPPQLFQDPIAYPINQPAFSGLIGPYEWAGKVFWVTTEVTALSGGQTQLVAYRSDDGGQSQPLTRITPSSPITIVQSVSACVNQGSGSTIVVSFLANDLSSSTGHIKTVTFDMSASGNTGAFGVANSTGIAYTSGSFGQTQIVQRANGDLVVFYDIASVVSAIIYNGISWGAPITIGTSLDSFPLIAANVIGGGNVGYWWADGTNVQYGVLSGSSHTNFVGPLEVDIKTLHNVPQYPFATIYDSVSDTAAWIFLQNLHPDMGVYVCTASPASAPTVGTTLIYRDVGDAIELLNPTLAGNAAGNSFVSLLWSVTQDTKLLVLQGTSLTAGPWSGPTTFYDGVVDPPSPAQADPHEVFPSYSKYLSDGRFANTSGFLYAVGGDPSFCGVLATMIPPPPPVQTLQLIKQVSGGTAVATDWTLSAAGPTPISGAGGVGPSNVDAGTYTLTETTVTDYTLEALICVGGTQVGNEVTLAAGQSAVCTFTNVFTGVTPPPPPPPFCIPFEPTTPSPSLVAYDEPLELKGS